MLPPTMPSSETNVLWQPMRRVAMLPSPTIDPVSAGLLQPMLPTHEALPTAMSNDAMLSESVLPSSLLP